MSKIDAYVDAFKPQTASRKTCGESASRLAAKPSIIARVQELREVAAAECRINLKVHLMRLNQLSLCAERDGQYGAAVSAEVARGKASGLYIEKKEVTGPGGQPLNHAVRILFGPEEAEELSDDAEEDDIQEDDIIEDYEDEEEDIIED